MELSGASHVLRHKTSLNFSFILKRTKKIHVSINVWSGTQDNYAGSLSLQKQYAEPTSTTEIDIRYVTPQTQPRLVSGKSIPDSLEVPDVKFDNNSTFLNKTTDTTLHQGIKSSSKLCI